MKKFKGIIFDFNGTVIKDDEFHLRAWQKHAASFGKGFTEETYFARMHGSTNDLIYKEIFGLDVSEADKMTVGQEKETYYREFMKEAPAPFAKGFKELLAFLKENNIPHAIATSSEISNVRFFDDIYGLFDLFDGNVIYNDGTVRGKPFPDLFLKAGELLSLPMEDVITVEDANSGVRACRASGSGMVVGICPRGGELFNGKEYTDLTITDFTELDYKNLFLY